MEGLVDKLVELIQEYPVLVIGGSAVAYFVYQGIRNAIDYTRGVERYYNRPYEFPRPDIFNKYNKDK